ncbi:MAG: hypothetical protein HQL45_04825 [Alphaproteobacteria bacterium]|nr:hypothetical protein [Alphaproteobacteria bacterium]
MVYLKCNDDYADFDFNLLKDFLELIDTKIAEGDNKFKLTKNECVLDTIEYYAGFGFIAIQRYFHSTYPQVMPDKRKALDACPNGLMAVLNAGANFAKHSEEWPIDQELGKNAEKTINTFFGNDDLSNHPCANKLFALTQSLFFSNLIPIIEEWRNALDSFQSLSESTG